MIDTTVDDLWREVNTDAALSALEARLRRHPSDDGAWARLVEWSRCAFEPSRAESLAREIAETTDAPAAWARLAEVIGPAAVDERLTCFQRAGRRMEDGSGAVLAAIEALAVGGDRRDADRLATRATADGWDLGTAISSDSELDAQITRLRADPEGRTSGLLAWLLLCAGRAGEALALVSADAFEADDPEEAWTWRLLVERQCGMPHPTTHAEQVLEELPEARRVLALLVAPGRVEDPAAWRATLAASLPEAEWAPFALRAAAESGDRRAIESAFGRVVRTQSALAPMSGVRAIEALVHGPHGPWMAERVASWLHRATREGVVARGAVTFLTLELGRIGGPPAAMDLADRALVPPSVRGWLVFGALSSIVAMAFAPGWLDLGLARRLAREQWAFAKRHEDTILAHDACAAQAIHAGIGRPRWRPLVARLAESDRTWPERWMRRVVGEYRYLEGDATRSLECLRPGLGAFVEDEGGDGGAGLVAMAEAELGERRSAGRCLEYARDHAHQPAERATVAMAEILIAWRDGEDSAALRSRLQRIPGTHRIFRITPSCRAAYWRVAKRLGAGDARWLRAERRRRRLLGFPRYRPQP